MHYSIKIIICTFVLPLSTMLLGDFIPQIGSYYNINHDTILYIDKLMLTIGLPLSVILGLHLSAVIDSKHKNKKFSFNNNKILYYYVIPLLIYTMISSW